MTTMENNNKQGDKEMNKQALVARLADWMTSGHESEEVRAMWERVAEELVTFEAGGCVEDGAGDVADGILDGWCTYYGDAETLARGIGLVDSDADEGLAILLENGADELQGHSLISLAHAAWCEALRSELYQRVVGVCELLGELDGLVWQNLGLDIEAAAVAARLWADGSALSVLEIAETAGNLTVAEV